MGKEGIACGQGTWVLHACFGIASWGTIAFQHWTTSKEGLNNSFARARRARLSEVVGRIPCAIVCEVGSKPFPVLTPCSDGPQVRQREQRQQMMGVLLQTAEADLHQPELPLDYPERMLHLVVSQRMM
jgi:hypothetical protein